MKNIVDAFPVEYCLEFPHPPEAPDNPTLGEMKDFLVTRTTSVEIRDDVVGYAFSPSGKLYVRIRR
jgi:hypothetical protein